MASRPTSRLHVRVDMRLMDDYWDVEIEMDDASVGGGTCPDFPLDLAGNILHGDTNDHLNGSQGVLGDRLREMAQSSHIAPPGFAGSPTMRGDDLEGNDR